MSLIARNGAMTVSPRRPRLSEVFKQQVAQCFTIVGHNHRVAIHQLVEVCLQRISTPFLKLLEQIRGVIGFRHLVAVVEEGVGVGRMSALESLLDVLEIVADGHLVEVVYHQSGSARCCAFHPHHPEFLIKRHDAPWPFAGQFAIEGERRDGVSLLLLVDFEFLFAKSLDEIDGDAIRKSVDAHQLAVACLLAGWREVQSFQFALVYALVDNDHL